ncbi:MAG: hypothetical protein EU518_00915 [Promethearchaeota archaeon]|nr:MAG: hypothetical protein EU518_00915 [Candidatus Lokiarchaeota archaeon]
MSFSKRSTILFDVSHNEMLNLSESEYSDFLNLLKTLNQDIIKNENSDITDELLVAIDILVIGNPINDYFSTSEINNIIDFVKQGGSLLLISEYGGDSLQKTNINDISGKYFDIFFEKTILKENKELNQNISSILNIKSFPEHDITHQLREVVIGGSCSILLKGNAIILLELNDNVWSERYNSSINDWDQDQKKEKYILSACSTYGKGKIVALGDVDIFSKDPNFGINQLENRKFIKNIFNWLIKPNEEDNSLNWALNRIGAIENKVQELNVKINNLIETITLLENRISDIEKKEVNIKNAS